MPSLNAGIRSPYTAHTQLLMSGRFPLLLLLLYNSLDSFGRKTKVENPSNGPSATEELGTVGTISIHTAKFHMHKMPFCLQ